MRHPISSPPSRRPRTGIVTAFLTCALALSLAACTSEDGGGSGESSIDQLSGVRPEADAVLPGTEHVVPKDAADKDGWKTEVFSQNAGSQLQTVVKSLASQKTKESLTSVLAESVQMAPLRPSDLTEAFRDTAFVVRRASVSSLKAQSLTAADAAGFAKNLSGLLSAFQGAKDLHSKIKVFDVRLGDAGSSPEIGAYVYVDGRHEAGTFQIKTTWRTTWKPAEANGPPRLLSVRVEDYEEVEGLASAGPMFADCTDAVLSHNPIFEQQLRPGIDHWLGRVDIRFGLDIGGWQGVSVADVN
ncbi:MAG: hypothetical protein AAF517_23030, partial [Planctomycetota bacterium]